MKKILMLTVLLLMLCGCASEPSKPDDSPVPENNTEKYYLVGMVERTGNPNQPVYIHPSLKEEKNYSMNLEDEDLFDGFETGDTVRMTLRKETVRIDKNAYYDTYKVDSVERTDEMFHNKKTVYELIDMEPTEIVIKDFGSTELWEVILTDQDDINEVMNSLKDITVYDDGIREYAVGFSLRFIFRDETREVSVKEAGVVTVSRDGMETEYSYRYPNESWLLQIARKYCPEQE